MHLDEIAKAALYNYRETINNDYIKTQHVLAFMIVLQNGESSFIRSFSNFS